MADIVVTAANVKRGTVSKTKPGVAGETITAGQAVYYDSAAGTYKLCDADLATTDDCAGIAENNASATQPLDICFEGDINLGATLVVGTVYVISTTAGGIAAWADLLAADYVTVLGVASTAANLKLNIIVSGAVIPA